MAEIFPVKQCLAPIKTTLKSQSTIIDKSQIPEMDFSCFLAPENVIDGRTEKLKLGILKDKHHRSTQLPRKNSSLYEDKKGNYYSTLRLKGNGLYSGPMPDQKGKIRNLKKDQTGYILGLQASHEIEKAMRDSVKLIEMGIETEIPLFNYELLEVIIATPEQGVMRVKIEDAIRALNLPAEYLEIPFGVRVDLLGVNNRLMDFINAKNVFINSGLSEKNTQEFFLNDTLAFLISENQQKILALNLSLQPENILEFLQITTKRLIRNIAILHKNQGVHGRLTPDNLCMDGRFIDYDTLEWYAFNNSEILQKQQKDYNDALTAIDIYFDAVLSFLKLDGEKSIKIKQKTLSALQSHYLQSKDF